MAPVRGAGPEAMRWGLILGPLESGKPNKTGEFDESALIDWEELDCIGPFMRNLQLRPPGSFVWNFTQAQFHASLVEASLLGGTDILHPEPYALRHGGASHDALSKRRGLSSVKKRGRWRDDRSVRRYEKATVPLHELNKLHPNVIQFGRFIADNLGNAFRKILPIPQPPRQTWLPPESQL